MPVLNALDLCNGCEIEPSIPSSPGGYCADCERQARGDDCAHEPNDAGTGCRFCGIASTPVAVDELRDAFVAAIVAIGEYEHRDLCDGEDGCGEYLA